MVHNVPRTRRRGCLNEYDLLTFDSQEDYALCSNTQAEWTEVKSDTEQNRISGCLRSLSFIVNSSQLIKANPNQLILIRVSVQQV